MDREKVIKGLECCLAVTKCGICPYNDEKELWCGNNNTLLEDALELLKKDEKRIADYQRWHENQKNTIKELLKAKEAVEPKMLEFIDEGLTWEKYELPSCGKCGALLGDALYCPNCGTAVNWNGTH